MNVKDFLLNCGNLSSETFGERRKERVIFTQQQTIELKRQFILKKYLNAQERETLAATIGLKPSQVKTWFQNQRYNCKRQEKEQDIYEVDRKNNESSDEVIPDGPNISLKLKTTSDTISMEIESSSNNHPKQCAEYSNISPTNPFFPFEQDYKIFHRFANTDTISKVLGVPVVPAVEETIKKQHEELAAKSKLVKTMKGCEIYEYNEDGSEEDPEVSMSTRRTETSQEEESGSTIVSPFDALPGLNWPKEATLRFLSLIAVNGVFGDQSVERIFYGFLSEKMAIIKSDEPGLFPYCVAEKDRKNIGKVPGINLKPNYSIRPSPQECEKKMNQFYNMEYIKTKQMDKAGRPGRFEYKKSRTKYV
ncbi:hypothetical protein FO519_000617 [Halicephalobus sp. NKZ332]|nr:hypothetical protein FO519_000617 [Halicephalobus sp. NKZ332]